MRSEECADILKTFRYVFYDTLVAYKTVYETIKPFGFMSNLPVVANLFKNLFYAWGHIQVVTASTVEVEVSPSYRRKHWWAF